MLPIEPKVAYVAFVAILVPVYLRQYGPGNFLWFSDVALFGGCLALLFELPLVASMQAIAVLIPELLWTADFTMRLARGSGLGGGTMTQYMFDPSIPRAIRALSLFHIWLPPALIWMVWRMGYDRRGPGRAISSGSNTRDHKPTVHRPERKRQLGSPVAISARAVARGARRPADAGGLLPARPPAAARADPSAMKKGSGL